MTKFIFHLKRGTILFPCKVNYRSFIQKKGLERLEVFFSCSLQSHPFHFFRPIAIHRLLKLVIFGPLFSTKRPTSPIPVHVPLIHWFVHHYCQIYIYIYLDALNRIVLLYPIYLDLPVSPVLHKQTEPDNLKVTPKPKPYYCLFNL